MGELQHALKNDNCEIADSPMQPERLVSLLKLVDDETISLKTAREIFLDLFHSSEMPDNFIREHGLMQLSDDSELEALISEIVEAHPTQCEEYKAGKESLLGFFVGQVMKASKGKANPKKVKNELLQY